mmetsp:Transcript_67097/g.162245  ORF Transcript_67097/g.162245 Transcript_67097/m.162245 type:complete len:250 (+) Transcript_67097:210-959(+)
MDEVPERVDDNPDSAHIHVEQASSQAEREKPHIQYQLVLALAQHGIPLDPLWVRFEEHGGDAEEQLVERHHVLEHVATDDEQGVDHVEDRDHERSAARRKGHGAHSLGALLDAADEHLPGTAGVLDGHAGVEARLRLHHGVGHPRPELRRGLRRDLRRLRLRGLEDGALHPGVRQARGPRALDLLRDLGGPQEVLLDVLGRLLAPPVVLLAQGAAAAAGDVGPAAPVPAGGHGQAAAPAAEARHEVVVL